MARMKRSKDRPFPWRCGSCEEMEVYRTPIEYEATIKYEGRPYKVKVPDLTVPKCRKCGEVVFDNQAGRQINVALRDQLGLLHPVEIRIGRTDLGLSQKEFASLLGFAEESVSRWETDSQIQSRSVDRQIRSFFEFPALRQALSEFERGKSFGETANMSTPPEPAPADIEEVLAALTKSRARLEEQLEDMPSDLIPGMARKPTDISYQYKSFLKAAADYIQNAPAVDVKWVTLFLESRGHQAAVRDRLRWVSSYFRSCSEGEDPMFERLGWITQELENVPQSEAVPLLENFSGLLAVWKTRAGSPSIDQLSEERSISDD